MFETFLGKQSRIQRRIVPVPGKTAATLQKLVLCEYFKTNTKIDGCRNYFIFDIQDRQTNKQTNLKLMQFLWIFLVKRYRQLLTIMK